MEKEEKWQRIVRENEQKILELEEKVGMEENRANGLSRELELVKRQLAERLEVLEEC